MRAGLPIVAPNECGFSALIEEFDCGVCVDYDDPRSIGKAVYGLLTDEARRKRLADNAYQAHAEPCNYESQYQPMLELMARLS
jgi:glycosyltransferase involved in cell wall biosynthesis